MSMKEFRAALRGATYRADVPEVMRLLEERAWAEQVLQLIGDASWSQSPLDPPAPMTWPEPASHDCRGVDGTATPTWPRHSRRGSAKAPSRC